MAIGRPAGHAHGLGLADALPQGAHGAGVAECSAALGVETDAGEGSGVRGLGIEMEAFAFGAAEEDRRQLVAE